MTDFAHILAVWIIVTCGLTIAFSTGVMYRAHQDDAREIADEAAQLAALRRIRPRSQRAMSSGRERARASGRGGDGSAKALSLAVVAATRPEAPADRESASPPNPGPENSATSGPPFVHVENLIVLEHHRHRITRLRPPHAS